MSKQAMYGLAALIVLVIIGGVIYMQSQNKNEEASETNSATLQNDEATLNNNTESTLPTDSTPPATDQGQFSGEDDIMSPDVAVHEITFSGTAFSPSTLTIKNGDIVVFKNNSDKDFWPASAPHPSHTNYPEFDAKAAIAPGKTFQFKFTKVGAWGFHDHLTPSAFGKITVE